MGKVSKQELNEELKGKIDLVKSSESVRAESTTKLVVEVRTDDPVSPEVGRIWFRSDL